MKRQRALFRLFKFTIFRDIGAFGNKLECLLSVIELILITVHVRQKYNSRKVRPVRVRSVGIYYYIWQNPCNKVGVPICPSL